jgi:hypothetical protein
MKEHSSGDGKDRHGKDLRFGKIIMGNMDNVHKNH